MSQAITLYKQPTPLSTLNPASYVGCIFILNGRSYIVKIVKE
ncbi:similar to microfilament and actin filament cross-linker protein isoform b, isoform CRA_b [Rattus norvegicus]|uniref:Similar to microfilament and actin filament cross-linker protein isoform b, isoform CRA_b n=1 Tax=Rattus norvegicus TaxID=10116 RepID=A6IS29_RAT|nr:similar to microfilament and actin filament cross-linker protein isoform b, isoform CRA_b [Rattus norvegicus]